MPLTLLTKYAMSTYQYTGLDIRQETYFESADTVNDNGFTLSNAKDYLIIENSGISSATVTIETPITVSIFDVDDLILTIPQGSKKIFGPFPKNIFEGSSPNSGKIKITTTGAGAADISYLVIQV